MLNTGNNYVKIKRGWIKKWRINYMHICINEYTLHSSKVYRIFYKWYVSYNS